MPGLKEDERGLLFIEIKIRVYLKVFLNAVLADTRNYCCNYASFECARYMTKILKKWGKKNTGKKDGWDWITVAKRFFSPVSFTTASGASFGEKFLTDDVDWRASANFMIPTFFRDGRFNIHLNVVTRWLQGIRIILAGKNTDPAPDSADKPVF